MLGRAAKSAKKSPFKIASTANNSHQKEMTISPKQEEINEEVFQRLAELQSGMAQLLSGQQYATNSVDRACIPQRRKDNNTTHKKGREKEERNCFHCGIKGHLKRQCYRYLRQQAQREMDGRPSNDTMETISNCPPDMKLSG